MSQYERRRRSNVLSGDESRLPIGGNTRVWQRGSGHLAAFSVCLGGRLDKTGTHAIDGPRGEAVGKPSVARVYTNQRLNLSKPWEGTRRTCQGLEPDPGNLAVRDFRGASRNVCHGETVNPPCDRKSRTGNPSPTAGRARSLSQPKPESAWTGIMFRRGQGVKEMTSPSSPKTDWTHHAYRLGRCSAVVSRGSDKIKRAAEVPCHICHPLRIFRLPHG